MKEKMIVVGAGLVGSLHAILLAKRGFDVEVYERRPDLRKVELQGGRSINLALSDRGWKAIAMAGMEEEIKSISIPMHSRKMHAIDNSLTEQAYGKDGQAIFSVSRGDLNKRMLLEASKYDNVKFFFNHKCLDVKLDEGYAVFEDENGNRVESSKGRIFGTDGAFSAVRNRMMRTDRFNYSQEYLKHGYKELLLPANPDGTHMLDKHFLHIWPRGQYMLIALPNLDGSFTCTLFFPFEGEYSFDSLQTKEQVNSFFSEVFPDFTDLMNGDVSDEYFRNPTSSLCIIRCEPWNHGDKVLLMGDAAHAIVPFYGQGMNSGFEDCSIYAEMYDEIGDDWAELFDAFAKQRKPDGDAIADLAVHNYYVMRDFVADPMFLLQKKIESKIYNKYPEKWMPLYSQVTFSHIRYSEALAAGKRQDAIMKQVMDRPDINDVWDSPEIEQEIIDLLDR